MDKLTPIVIDLDKAKEKHLDESFLEIFGWGIKKLLGAVFGDSPVPVNLKGRPSDVRSFLDTLSAEKSYIQDFRSLGLNNPRTYKSKSQLKAATGKFERKTGIKWPFK